MNSEPHSLPPTRAAAVLLALWLVAPALGAEAPHLYAIRGARIETAAGAAVPSGTVLIRDGRIAAVGADVEVPPGAHVIEGGGLIVYPGLIGTAGVAFPVPAVPASPRSRDEVERWKRTALLRPHLQAASQVALEAGGAPQAAAGITSVFAIPGGEVFAGQSALVNVVAPPVPPPVGGPAVDARALTVVKSPVALHVRFTPRPRGAAYPQSLLGVMAFIRQAFLDAGHHRLATDYYARHPGAPRPEHDPALAALGPAAAGELPVAFTADLAREIRRALDLSADLGLDPIVVGGLEAAEVAAELRAAGARVLLGVDYPERPAYLAPDEDEPLRVLRQRAAAPAAAAALARAGVVFAFHTGGLAPDRYVRNVARAIDAGLPPDAALRALTIDAAAIAGVADRLGSIAPGKIANVIVTDGDLFAEGTTIRHVFVDGRLVPRAVEN